MKTPSLLWHHQTKSSLCKHVEVCCVNHLHLRNCTLKHTNTLARTCSHMHTRLYIRAHTNVNMNTHTHTHTRLFTFINTRPLSTTRTDIISIGSYNGVLRLFLPTKGRFYPSHVLLETQLDQAILGLHAGPFEITPDGHKPTLAVLHPRAIAFYEVECEWRCFQDLPAWTTASPTASLTWFHSITHKCARSNHAHTRTHAHIHAHAHTFQSAQMSRMGRYVKLN